MRNVEPAGSNQSGGGRSLPGLAGKHPLSSRRLSVAALLCGLALAPLAAAEPLRFALLAKRVDNPFFRLVGAGCAEAAEARGDTCLLLGPSGPAHFRRQSEALEQALDRNLNGIGLAVIHSKWLAEHALKRLGQTPLITFDSDLEPAERHLRRGYVGIDDLAFGRQPGLLAQRFRPQGGTLCILNSSAQESNLRERLQGLRQQLRGVGAPKEQAERLNGENGWQMMKRLAQGLDVPERVLVKTHVHLPEAPPHSAAPL